MQVVPKTGWSYNKGEPLLIYEYMKNGSLDQHLFQSGGFGQGKPLGTGLPATALLEI
jgi:interleukin-1 receptor-associated kinase 1